MLQFTPCAHQSHGHGDMVPWYKTKPGYFEEERSAILRSQPTLTLGVYSAGTPVGKHQKLSVECALCLGVYQLRVPDTDRHHDYSVVILIHPNHPKEIPALFCDDARLPAGNLDRHILRTGQACLGVEADIRNRWNPKSGLMGFLDQFVAPYLAWQVYYEAHGCAGPFGERSHGALGILEFYAEILSVTEHKFIPGLMALIGSHARPKGHIPCPCGSGLRLRDCHAQAVWQCYGKLRQQDVLNDLSRIREEMAGGFAP